MMPPMVEGALANSFELDRVIPRILATAESQLASTIPDDRLRRQCLSIAETLLRYLSQAVAVEEPGVVAQYVSWVCGPGATDDTMADVLAALIKRIRVGLEAELKDDVLEAAAVALSAAETALEQPARIRDRDEIDASTPEGRRALQYLGALLAGQREDALDVIRNAADNDIPPARIIEDMILPVQRTVGALWHAGEISVADEHFATATSEFALTMFRHWYPKVEQNGHRVVISTISGDLHALGARVASDFFEMAGWQSVFLGPNMPSHDLLQGVLDYRAQVLAMAVTSLLHLRPVAILIRQAQMEDDTKNIRIILGGRAMDQFPNLGERIGAHAVAESPAAAPAIALGLLESS